MDIVMEVAVWGAVCVVISVALILVLPAFFRLIRSDGADVFPDFLKGSPHPPGDKP